MAARADQIADKDDVFAPGIEVTDDDDALAHGQLSYRIVHKFLGTCI